MGNEPMKSLLFWKEPSTCWCVITLGSFSCNYLTEFYNSTEHKIIWMKNETKHPYCSSPPITSKGNIWQTVFQRGLITHLGLSGQIRTNTPVGGVSLLKTRSIWWNIVVIDKAEAYTFRLPHDATDSAFKFNSHTVVLSQPSWLEPSIQ